MHDRRDQDELRATVATWNAQKREVAMHSMRTGMEPFTALHNTITRQLIRFIGNENSAAWWEGLAELAMNAAGLIRSGNVSPSVRVIDAEDVRQRSVVNGKDVGA